MNILVVRLDNIGDVVLTSPFLRELRRNYPEARITLVVQPKCYDLVKHCPYVDEVLRFGPMQSFAQGNRLSAKPMKAIEYVRTLFYGVLRLRGKRFGLAILPRWGIDYYYASRLISFSGARERVAYSEKVDALKSLRNAGFDRYFTRLLTGAGVKHEVERSLDVITALGGKIENNGLEIWTNEEDEKFADSLWDGRGCSLGASFVCVAPGAAEKNRVWSRDSCAAVMKQIMERSGAMILIVGANEDRELAEFCIKRLGGPQNGRVIDMTGRLTLRQLGAVMRKCALFIGSDSGPMHIAAAAGIPVVEISSWPENGSRSSERSIFRFGPWGVKYAVANPKQPLPPCKDYCSAAYAHCIDQVSVEMVMEAIRKLGAIGGA